VKGDYRKAKKLLEARLHMLQKKLGKEGFNEK
jgi:hypothetical protein